MITAPRPGQPGIVCLTLQEKSQLIIQTGDRHVATDTQDVFAADRGGRGRRGAGTFAAPAVQARGANERIVAGIAGGQRGHTDGEELRKLGATIAYACDPDRGHAENLRSAWAPTTRWAICGGFSTTGRSTRS